MDSNREIHLGKLTRREFRQRMESSQLQACIVPIGAVEQHLEHLAMEHDWHSVSDVAQAVAKKLAPQALIASGVMAGISEHHMKHAGTLSLRPATFLAVLTDLIDSMVHAGFKNILVLNGHGGNVAPCQGVWDQWLRLFPVNLHFLSYWDVLTEEDARELLVSGHRLPEDLPGHAQEFETSVALAAFAQNVRTDALNDQKDRSPSLATAQTGREFLNRIIERSADYLQKMIDGNMKSDTPAFSP